MERLKRWRVSCRYWWKEYWKPKVNKHDLFTAAALSGLIARGGVVGGPAHNKHYIKWAKEWADEIMKGQP
jgi:hypothetical protein